MSGDAEGRKGISRFRRPDRTVPIALAVLLLLGGGVAVAVGIAGQEDAPPRPPVTTAPSATGSLSRGSAETPATTTAPMAVALPIAVSIPAIEVQSELLTLGLNPDGTLAVPQPGPDYDKAAWFDGSPRPGEIGPAVIEGHVDSAANGASVFYSLGDLVFGDRIDVTRQDGSVVSFVVDEVRLVPKDDFPTFDVYGNTEGPELRLITCGGPFDSDARSYEDNVVVFARLAA